LKALNALILVLFFGVLAWASFHLPARGDPHAPMHREISAAGSPVAGNYYVRMAYEDTHTDNMVTVVLADYRAFDTLGETIVVFTAGIGVFLILARRKR
jgi:multicomponent Na+:H+ antiporter subunit B